MIFERHNEYYYYSGLLHGKHTDNNLAGFSDANCAGDLNDRKSTSGYMFLINGTAVGWRSKKHSCVALPTTEAKYMALASAAQVWIKQLTTDLMEESTDATVIFDEDNQSAISMTKNTDVLSISISSTTLFKNRSRMALAVQLRYCRSEEMIADMLTKGLCLEKFVKPREMTGVNMMTT